MNEDTDQIKAFLVSFQDDCAFHLFDSSKEENQDLSDGAYRRALCGYSAYPSVDWIELWDLCGYLTGSNCFRGHSIISKLREFCCEKCCQTNEFKKLEKMLVYESV